jgi:hypothetical protein
VEELGFKRKVSFRAEVKTDRIIKCEPVKQREAKPVKGGKKIDPPPNENQTPRSQQELPSREMRTEPNAKLPLRHHKTSLTDIKKIHVLPTPGKTPPLSTPRAAKDKAEGGSMEE